MKQRHKMAVASHLLLRNGAGAILFLRRAGTGYADGSWSVPAGHVDAGETLAQACVRESMEEIGVELQLEDLRPVLVQHKRDFDGEERVDIFFVAELPHGVVPGIVEPDHCDGLLWAPMDRPPTPIVGYVAAALRTVTGDPSPFVSYYGFS